MEILSSFNITESIPCRFSILHNQIKEIEKIKKRASEIEYSFCKVKCPNQSIVFIKDKYERVVETIDKSENQYSFLENFPTLPPLTKRKVVLKTEESRIVMACPG